MTAHPVAAAIAHPDYVPSEDDCPNTTLDLGLVHLAAPIRDIAPMPRARAADPAAAAGAVCDAVGYGIHDEGTDETVGQKRTGTETVRSSSGTSIEGTEGTAIADSGDSDGPLLCGGILVGATSCHIDGDWPQHQIEHYARVDVGSAWIDQQIAAWHTAE